MVIMLRTPLTDLLNIGVPIIQAPIGSATCPELAAAVSNAGRTWHVGAQLEGSRKRQSCDP